MKNKLGRPANTAQDLSGNVYGELTVIKRTESKDNKNRPYFLCKCNCGKEVSVRSDYLKNGGKTDCGHVNRQRLIESNKIHNSTHGLSGTRLFRIWSNMLFRCSNEKSPNYDNYGGRGIAVCNAWKNSVHEFISWANENGYEETLTLERIDVNGNYEPSNCTWITFKEQGFNKRNNRLVEINGVAKTMPEWAEESGINESTLRYRYTHGWRGEKLLTPVKK